jgi:hypothetical protein
VSPRELIRRGCARSAREWRLALEATVLAVAIEGALRIISLRRVVGWCQRHHPVAGASPEGRDSMAPASRWPYHVLPWPPTCLRRSLVLTALLRRRGLPATVRFGVRRAAGLLEAHAWVECDGVAVDAASHHGFDVLEPAVVPSADLTRTARWSP